MTTRTQHRRADPARRAVSSGAAQQPDRLLDAAERIVGGFLAKTRIPSASLAVARGGQLVGVRSFGDGNDQGEPANQDTLYGVGSLIKSLTAVAVLQLRDRELLDLDAPVRRYLPWFRLATPTAAEVTVRHLLTHTSGIPPSATMVVWQAPDRIRPSLEEGVRALARVVPNAAPGQRWQYSNANYNILGLLVQTLSGTPYQDYIGAHVLAPLGMAATTFDPSTAGHRALAAGHFPFFGFYRQLLIRDEIWLAPAGSALFSNVTDLARYANFQLGHGPDAVLSHDQIQETHTGTVPTTGSLGESDRYGFGWVTSSVAGKRIVWHEGGVGGYSAVLVLAPEDDLGVVVLLGATTFLTKQLVKALACAIGGQEPPTPRPDPVQRLSALLLVLVTGSVLALAGASAQVGAIALPVAVPLWTVTALLWLLPLARHRLSAVVRAPVRYGWRGWPTDLLLTYLALLTATTVWSIKAGLG